MEAIASTHVFDNEINRTDLVSPEQSLRVSLARTGKRNYAKTIFFSWPNLEVSSRKMASVLSHQYPNAIGDGFLLDKAVMAACEAFERSVENENFTKRMALYLSTMLNVVAEEVMAWETHGILPNGDTVGWQLGDLPVFEWVKRRGVARVVFTRCKVPPRSEEKEAAKIMLAANVVTYNDLLLMKRAKF